MLSQTLSEPMSYVLSLLAPAIVASLLGVLYIHLECECRGEHGTEEHVVLSEEEATYPIVLAANSYPTAMCSGCPRDSGMRKGTG